MKGNAFFIVLDEIILKKSFDNIKTPLELLKFMNTNIKFGFVGTNNRVYDGSDLDASIFASEIYWTLSSPTVTLQHGLGTCFDQVELEREWFTKNGYLCKTLYITFLIGTVNSYPTHAYLVYKDNDKWYWFEAYDKANFGIHEFESLEDLITAQMQYHVNLAMRFNPMDEDTLSKLHIFEYSMPKFGIKKKEILDFVTTSQEVPIID